MPEAVDQEEKDAVEESETQKTEPPLTEEEYNILRRNMSGMGSSSFCRLIEPPSEVGEGKIEWTESNQALFSELTRTDTLENNPGFMDPKLLLSSEDESSRSEEFTQVPFTLIQEDISSSTPNDTTTTSTQPPPLRHTSSFPSTEQFPGEFGFHCAFEKLNSNHKNKFWEYSEKLNKLFIEFNKNIQISFMLGNPNKDAYTDLSVRAMAVYAEEASIKEPVLRCPAHSAPEHESNANFPWDYLSHIIRVDHPGSGYFTDKASGRNSVLVPISQPAVGTNYCSRIYKFVCLCSDPGGINRRPVKLIFTLERMTSRETLGRDSLDLRICACPGRDMLKEEKRLRMKEERILRVACGMKSSQLPNPGDKSEPDSKKLKTTLCSDDVGIEEMILLPVSRMDFDKLNEFAEAAMIVRHPERKEGIIRERKRLLAQANGSSGS